MYSQFAYLFCLLISLDLCMCIAVVIPIYNRAGTIAQALNSVAHQILAPDQLIVVDDGSSDDTADCVRKWLQQHSPAFPARLVLQENTGAAGARNTGANAVRESNILAFLDSDDVWPPDYLARAAHVMNREPKAVGATADRYRVRTETGRGRLRRFSHLTGYVTPHLFNGPLPGQSTTVYRATDFFEAGGFDPKLKCAEDQNLQLRLSLRGPWAHLPGTAVTTYKTGQSVLSQIIQLSKQYDDRRYRAALMLDRFIHQQGGSKHLKARDWRPRLSHMWFHAGRQLQAISEFTLARDCFSKAMTYAPRSPRIRWACWRCPADSKTSASRSAV